MFYCYLWFIAGFLLFVYFLIGGPILLEGSPFGRFFNSGMFRVEEVILGAEI